MSNAIRIVQADYGNLQHAEAIVLLLDAYARDPMGGGQSLSAFACQHLVVELSKLPNALIMARSSLFSRIAVKNI